MMRLAVALLIAFAAPAALANDARADRHAARDLHRDQSRAGLRRSGHQRGARPRRRADARARQARGCAGHHHRRERRAGRDRQREKWRGRHRLRGVRSGARRAGRFLAKLCAGAEHLSGAGRLADQIGRRRGSRRACVSASARAMPATISSPARSSMPSSSATRAASATHREGALAGELDAYAGNRMRLHGAAQKTPGLRLVPDNFYGVEQAVIVPKGNAARLAIVETFIDEARASGLIAESIARAGLVGVDVAPAGQTLDPYPK